ncbi:MAG TPA: CHAD domain-containing protein [Pyrinomonadaceae bacterium]|nr:CHAD domain-containing protein [Pyrinomonadaceae bacterium]
MKAKEIDGLDCEAGAVAGIQLVLRTRFDEMCAFRAAALFFEDPKGVHDMRVASRRLRGLVRDFSPYFRRSRRFQHAKDGLKRVAQALGSVRDEDVAIAALEELATNAPPETVAGIKPLVEQRRLKQETARAELKEALTEAALEELREKFNALLEQGLKVPRSLKENGLNQEAADVVSFRQAGREVIAAGLLELQDLSASLYRPFKTKRLHRMRLAAKRLRYDLDLFAPCMREPLRDFAKEIAKLQTSLGELHDCDVWIAQIGTSLLDSGMESVGAQSPERSAAVWLLDYFVKKRAENFSAALTRWREWETTGFLGRLQDLV